MLQVSDSHNCLKHWVIERGLGTCPSSLKCVSWTYWASGSFLCPYVNTYTMLGATHTELNKIEKRLFNIPVSSEGQLTGDKRTSDRSWLSGMTWHPSKTFY